jgi:hypothetical protein
MASSTALPPLPAFDAGESTKVEEAGVASDSDASDEKVAIDSSLPDITDPFDDHARTCTWPSASISSQSKAT